MRRWDLLLENYLGELRTRGLAEGHDCGTLPRTGPLGLLAEASATAAGPGAGGVGSAWSSTSRAGRAFRSKATVGGIVSALRGMG